MNHLSSALSLPVLTSVKKGWRKRGRPKLHKASIDLGTQELQAKRKILYGEQLLKHKTLIPCLDLLDRYGYINQDQYQAGQAYLALFQEILPTIALKASNTSSTQRLGSIGCPYNPWQTNQQNFSKRQLKKRQEWDALQGYLERYSSFDLAAHLYRNLIEQKLPKHFFSPDHYPKTLECQMLQKGLKLLGDHFKKSSL